MIDKEFKDMTFKERVDWATQYTFAALIKGGTPEMRTAMFEVSNCWARWPKSAPGKEL